MGASRWGGLAVVGFVSSSVACASFSGTKTAGHGDVTMMFQNATSASVCEVELWTSQRHEVVRLEAQPIGPGERRELDFPRSPVIHHLRARTCQGVVVAQQDVSVESDVDVVVR